MRELKTKTKLAAIVAAGALAVTMLATGCSTEPVAATVNGENIMESTVTDYITGFREDNELTDDQAWAQWLVDNGRDAESVREDAINYYVNLALIDQDAAKNGIQVTDEEVNSQYDEIKNYYSENDEDFVSQLEQMGYTEQSYKEYLKQSLTQEKLTEAVVATDAVEESEVLETANSYATILDGSKKIRTIIAGNKEAADEIKARLDKGEDFETVAEEVSNSGEYDGWTTLMSADQTIYEAIENSKKGDVTDVIPSDDESRYYIVKVQDVLDIDPDKGFAKASDIPEDLYSEFEETVSQSTASTEFDTYLQGLKDSADIVINPMPEGLPYDVSLDGVTTGTGDDGTDAEGADGDTVTETDVTEDVDGTVDQTDITTEDGANGETVEIDQTAGIEQNVGMGLDDGEADAGADATDAEQAE